jgi:bifunctional non-homologous end joining protein LigD
VEDEIVVPAADGATDFLGPAERAQGQIDERRACGVRPVLSERPRSRKYRSFSARPNSRKSAPTAGFKGVLSKGLRPIRADARTPGSRSTCAQRESLTIAGFALDGTTRDGYVRRRKGDDLVYAAKVDHGFDKVSAADLQKRLKSLLRRTQPYTKRIGHKGIGVEPKLLAGIEYRAKSAKGPAPVLPAEDL